MTANKKLNYILHKWDNVPAWTWEGFKIEMKGDKYIDDHNLKQIVEKLIRDKYVEAVDGSQAYTIDREINDLTYLRRNFDGTVFIKNGGYVWQRRWKLTKVTATILNILLLLIIGFIQAYEGCNDKKDKLPRVQQDSTEQKKKPILTPKPSQVLDTARLR